MKKISIIGSTGSIGTQTLDVIDKAESGTFCVTAMTAGKNAELFEAQVRKYRPKIAAMADEAAARDLKVRLSDTDTVVLAGEDGLVAAAAEETSELCVLSVVGIAGLKPAVSALSAGKHLALANKETLVAGGEIVTTLAKEKNLDIIPVDSEHSAIYQCLKGEKCVSHITLTASGGPFYGYDKSALESVTVEQALRHPNWSMGKKITIDCATLMNKGLEVIEARWLFNLPTDKIQVAIHRQSVVHSLVTFTDGSILCQMGAPDMRVPISVALYSPDRAPHAFSDFSLFNMPDLSFARPDTDVFSALPLCYDAISRGGIIPAALSGANEAAVEAFLKNKCSFTQITELVERAISEIKNIKKPTLSDIFEADALARETVRRFL